MGLEQRGNIEVGDQQIGELARPHADPDDGDVHSSGEEGAGPLHLEAAKEEAVAQRFGSVVSIGALAQEKGGNGDGENLDIHMRCGGVVGDVVKGGDEIDKGHVGEDRQRGDIVDWTCGLAFIAP